MSYSRQPARASFALRVTEIVRCSENAPEPSLCLEGQFVDSLAFNEAGIDTSIDAAGKVCHRGCTLFIGQENASSSRAAAALSGNPGDRLRSGRRAPRLKEPQPVSGSRPPP